MKHWFLICQSQYFDIKKAFEKNDIICWPLNEEMQVGDIAYFYVTNPYKAILYKCKVEELGVHHLDDVTKECVLDYSFYDVNQNYMKLSLVEAYPEDKFTDEKLRELGLQNRQMSVELSTEVLKYMGEQQESGPARKEVNVVISFVVFFAIFVIYSAIGDRTNVQTERMLEADDFLMQDCGELLDQVNELEPNYYWLFSEKEYSSHVIVTHRGIQLGDPGEKVFNAYWDVPIVEEKTETHTGEEAGENQCFRYITYEYIDENTSEKYNLHFYFNGYGEVCAIIYCNSCH